VRLRSRRFKPFKPFKLFKSLKALSANASDPDVLAQEIIADLKAALEQCREIAVDLGADVLKDRNDRQTSDGLPLSSLTRRFSVQLLCLLF